MEEAAAGCLTLLGERAYPQDTRIYMIGDPADDFYVLAEGIVRSSRCS